MILKSWKLIHDQQKFSSYLLSNSKGVFLTPEAQKFRIMTIKIKKLEKNVGEKYQKYAKIRVVKNLQDIPFNLEIIQ